MFLQCLFILNVNMTLFLNLIFKNIFYYYLRRVDLLMIIPMRLLIAETIRPINMILIRIWYFTKFLTLDVNGVISP